MREKMEKKMARAILLAVSVLAISGCGGGSGGEKHQLVSGTVQAPNAVIAFRSEPDLPEIISRFFITGADAALSGLAPVADGTQVELVRIDNSGKVVRTVGATTTTGGRYTFDLAELDAGIASDLLVRVADNATGSQMRAFVTGEVVDIDPVSESAARLVLDQIAASPGSGLTSFTARELRDLVISLDLLNTLRVPGAAGTIDAAVAAIRAEVAADPGILAFIAAAAGVGQTAEGPGDSGNFFPLRQGDVYVYEDDSFAGQFARTVTITGPQQLPDIGQVIVYTDAYSLNGDHLLTRYLMKNSQQIGDPWGAIDSYYLPTNFPVGLVSARELQNETFNTDLDGDGKPDREHIVSTLEIGGLETVSTPAGSFANSLRLELTTVTTYQYTGDYSPDGTATTVQTHWYAPGVGLVKRERASKGVVGDTTRSTLELTSYTPAGI